MRILLDTHLLLWWLGNSPVLSGAARSLISDPGNTVFVSAVSHWEIWLKVSLGKLTVPADFETRFAGESFESLPLMATHARGLTLLPWHHRDPFDPLLSKTAECGQLIR